MRRIFHSIDKKKGSSPFFSRRPIVYVALSGGVDSAVAAALLIRKGYDVRGIFLREYDMKTGSSPIFSFGDAIECTQSKDRQSALAVAAVLSIPFEEWDFRKEYERTVIRYMIREYKTGRTPNPDMMCNSVVKFGLFLKRALKEGADYIATGHYARITCHPEKYVIPAKVGIQTKHNSDKLDSRLRGNDSILFQAKDKNKDQTYFLAMLNQEQLRHCLFPIGGLLKSEVRKKAKEFGLPNWNRKDSQGICFIGKLSMKEFLKTAIPPKKGPLMTVHGERVGTHDGAAFFTIGQRHGLGCTGGGTTPYYVVAKDMKKNIVIVDREQPSSALYQKELGCTSVNWISGVAPTLPFTCTARTRYRQSLQRATIMSSRGATEGSRDPSLSLGMTERLFVTFTKPQRAVTSGQSVVFYKGAACLGGGIID